MKILEKKRTLDNLSGRQLSSKVGVIFANSERINSLDKVVSKHIRKRTIRFWKITKEKIVWTESDLIKSTAPEFIEPCHTHLK